MATAAGTRAARSDAGSDAVTLRRETAIARTAIAVIGLHYVDVAFRPAYLIFAPKGHGGETTLTDQYYDRAGEPKELWEIPEAKHVGGLEARPREYERRVVGFFRRALLAGGST